MNIAVRQPLQDILEDIRGLDPSSQPEDLADKAWHIGSNLVLVVGSIVDGLDEDDREADLEELRREVNAILDEMVGRLNLGFGAKLVASAVIPSVTAQLDAITLSGDRVRKVGELLQKWGPRIAQLGDELVEAA